MGFFRAVMCSGENWYTDIRFKDSDRLFKIQSSVTCLASKFSEWQSQVMRVTEEIDFLFVNPYRTNVENRVSS